mmetsp:Transcript_38078/g.122254  ORF Transcript_38078/g.122254 Transcript_38078/m.122254 type:complete len:227 (+) Transcript_38078:969-1649(+)
MGEETTDAFDSQSPRRPFGSQLRRGDFSSSVVVPGVPGRGRRREGEAAAPRRGRTAPVLGGPRRVLGRGPREVVPRAPPRGPRRRPRPGGSDSLFVGVRRQRKPREPRRGHAKGPRRIPKRVGGPSTKKCHRRGADVRLRADPLVLAAGPSPRHPRQVPRWQLHAPPRGRRPDPQRPVLRRRRPHRRPPPLPLPRPQRRRRGQEALAPLPPRGERLLHGPRRHLAP